jgi:metal-dependent amidase/aminoacylase/carboxypeptidase family protein
MLVSREIDPLESAVISFGQLEAGEAYNVIPEQIDMWGSLRALSPDVRDFLQSRLEEIVPLLAQTFRGLGIIKYQRNYPQVFNDEKLVDVVLNIAYEYMGKENVEILQKPLMSGEDFAFYTQIIPSCFMLFGTGGKYWVHHPKYDVPEDLLPSAASWKAYLALRLSNMDFMEEGWIE